LANSEADDVLSKYGYHRPEGAIVYSKKYPSGQQIINLNLEERPSSDTRAICCIYPYVTWVYPEINETVRKLVASSLQTIGALDVTLNMPAELILAKSGSARWYIYSINDFSEKLILVREFLTSVVIPFLDEHVSEESLVRAHENRDPRFEWISRTSFYIAAIHINAGCYDKAYQVLEAEYGRPRSRRIHAGAFDLVNELISKSKRV